MVEQNSHKILVAGSFPAAPTRVKNMTNFIDKLEIIVDDDTYQITYKFTGTITPEIIQDVIHKSFDFSYENLGKMIVDDIYKFLT